MKKKFKKEFTFYKKRDSLVNRKTGKYSIQLAEDIDEVMRDWFCNIGEYSLKGKYTDLLKEVLA